MATDAQEFATFDSVTQRMIRKAHMKQKAARKCWLCSCQHTSEAFGLPKCDYHASRGTDSPTCPNCS